MPEKTDKTDNNLTSHEAKTGGVPNKTSLYAVAAAHSKEAIETLYDLMKNSKNDGIRLGAARALLNKALPDIKQSDGSNYAPGEPFKSALDNFY